MNLELIREWVEALRSGKYEQGRLALRSKDDKYCCLGVLCDIAKDRLSLEWTLKGRYYIESNNCTILPSSLLELLGIGGYLGSISIDATKLSPEYGIPKNSTFITLVELNDYYKLSFTQIADILEQHYLM